MKNPPRTTKIRGQKHLLAYITPEEAALLKARGGSGELHHGIPSYPDYGDAGGFGGSGGGEAATGGWGGGDDRDDASDRAAERAAAQAAAARAISQAEAAAQAAPQMGMSPGAMGGAIGSAYQTAPSVGGGFDVNLNKAMTQIAMAPSSQRLGFTDRQIMKAYQTGKAPGIAGLFDMPLGRTQNYLTFDDPRKGIFSSFQSQAPSFGMPGFISELFGLNPYVTTGFNQDGSLGTGPDGDGPDTVPATYNPVTGEQDQCPDGYMFDEDLQACRMSADLPSFGTPITTPGPYEAGDYVRMGLLDVAPMGMSLFADRYGIPQTDFGAANLAFRRGAATRPQYFRQAPDLPGYTLLS